MKTELEQAIEDADKWIAYSKAPKLLIGEHTINIGPLLEAAKRTAEVENKLDLANGAIIDRENMVNDLRQELQSQAEDVKKMVEALYKIRHGLKEWKGYVAFVLCATNLTDEALSTPTAQKYRKQ